MRTFLPIAFLSFAVPVAVLALDFSDHSDRYKDASRFTQAERAGINLLTELDVTGGNPDGSFAPDRTLNRAEFTKIATLLDGSLVEIETLPQSLRNCFTDVRAWMWFAVYVCSAKEDGVVRGRPDELFHPEEPVNYAEAIKILSLLFEHDVAEGQGERWYEPFVVEAKRRGVVLPGFVAYDKALTRGEMSRLAAAFYAESQGELQAYRDAEKGIYSTSSRSSMSSSASSASSVASAMTPVNQSSSMSSVSSVSSASSVSSVPFLSRSRYLLLGTTVMPLLDGLFRVEEEEVVVNLSDLILRREVRSIERMWLVDENGTEVLEYLISTTDLEKRIWKGSATTSYRLPQNTARRFGVKVKFKERNQGSSNELFETERFSLDVVGSTTGSTRQLVPTDQHYPLSVTAQAELKSVKNALPTTWSMTQGNNKLLGTFQFSGSILPGAELRLTEVVFSIARTGVALSNFRIGGPAEVQQAECGVDSTDPFVVSCQTIPEAFRSLTSGSGKTLSLFANVSVTGTTGEVQVSLPTAGSLGTNGSVRWTDGTGTFNWIDTTSPLAVGTKWTVTK